jgi:hypothetical protein
LHVQGTLVTLTYCLRGSVRLDGTGEAIVPLQEVYSADGRSFARSVDLHFVAGETTSRVIENVDLARLGLIGKLHLTLAYSGGLVRVEGALLTPGAITIK